MDLYIVEIDKLYTIVVRASHERYAEYKATLWFENNTKEKKYSVMKIKKVDCNEIIGQFHKSCHSLSNKGGTIIQYRFYLCFLVDLI